MSLMGALAEADEQRLAWGKHWSTGKHRPEPQWPDTVAHQVPDMAIQQFVEACMSFPNCTWLCWGNLHPRALTQLPKRLILQLMLCTQSEKSAP